MRILKSMFFMIFLSFVSTHIFAQTQIEINDQTRNAYMKADKELNKVYKQLMGILGTQEKQLLRLKKTG